MADGRGDAQRCAGEGARHLGHQLFPGVGRRAEGAGLVAGEPRRMARPVSELVQGGAMPVDRLEVGLRPRYLHVVVGRTVERLVAADPKVRAGGGDEGGGLRQDEPLRDRGRRRGDLGRQAFALGDIEDREALQEQDLIRGPAVPLSPAPFGVGGEAVGKDDGHAALAATDIAAQRQRLAEREPGLCMEAQGDDRLPEDEDVDPGIATPGRGVGRHGQRGLGRVAAPGLDPGNPAGLQLGDDLFGDLLMEARPALAGAGGGGGRHRGAPRRAPRASLAATNPSRRRAAFSSSHPGADLRRWRRSRRQPGSVAMRGGWRAATRSSCSIALALLATLSLT